MMKRNLLKIYLAIFSLLVIGLAATSAGAQRRGRNWDGYPNWGCSYQLRATALDSGYNAGNQYGRDDARRGRRRNYNDISDYRNATTDYSSRLGDKELYRRYYREGFETGYEDGYRGY